MSVHKQPSGRWVVRWREGSRNRSKTFDRKRDADFFDAKVRRERQLGEVVPQRTGGVTLSDFMAEWVTTRSGLTEGTEKNQLYLIDAYIGPHIGHIPVRELRSETLETWRRDRLAEVEDKGKGHASLAKVISILQQALDKAVTFELLRANPVTHLERPASKKRIPVPATPEQVEAIRAWFLERERYGDATLVSLLAYAGLRPGEAVGTGRSQGLRWSDIDKTSITVYAGKKQQLRIIRPPRQVFTDLNAWKLASPSPFELVWPRRKDGERWTKWDLDNWRDRFFAKAAEAIGRPGLIPYDLRHSRASILAAEGKPITEAAYEMGHSPQMFLSTYAHLIEQARDRKHVDIEQWIAEARANRRKAANG